MHRIPPRRLVGSIGVVLALATVAACSGDDQAEEPSAPVVTEGEVAAEPDADVDTTPATTAPTAATTPDTTEPPPPTTEPTPERPSDPPRLAGLPPVELTTEQQGGGDRPLLEWSSVDGADYYGVHLYAPDESIYWTWLGHETSVFVGGETQLSDTMPGPSVVDEMTWSVVAYDAELLPIAVSNVRPISP